MTSFTQIVPGKVDNNGIRDISIPDYTVTSAVYPLHAPVISGVFPRGELADVKGTQWITTSDFNSIFGAITDFTSPFYSPLSLLIQQLGKGGQATIGIRRLSANQEVARVSISCFIKQYEVIDYERDLAGKFKRDPVTGDKIPTGKTYPGGLEVIVRPDDQAGTAGYGNLAFRTIPGTPATGETPAVPDTLVYPMFELPAGVGDVYNSGGINMGVLDSSANWRSIANFVKATGVFPFNLRMFNDSDAGIRVYTKATDKSDKSTFTLFPVIADKVQYSLKRAVGSFTGTNGNKKVTPIPCPFKDILVYEDNLDTICRLMYAAEKAAGNESLVEVGNRPYQQMNPFTTVNHNGAPYFAIKGDDSKMWDLTGAVKAQYGISPFYTKEGKLPAGTTVPEVEDPLGLLEGDDMPITQAQAWEITNRLMAEDLRTYAAGSEIRNYTRNRQSVFWDVGFSQEVKDASAELLNARKDIFVFSDATVWAPGKSNSLADIYSRLSTIAGTLRMYPESEKWGTPTVRASVNLIEAKLIGEATGDFFSGNLDLAYKFAQYAGNAAGTIIASLSPDHGDQRILTTMHSPNIEFEDDEVASDNFLNGAITLRPYDEEQLYRPALISVYNNVDSVLKDAVTGFLCICMEKITQDEWNTVSGDTTISSTDYVSLVKDGSETKMRDRLGGQVKNIVTTPSYTTGVVGSRAVMSTVIRGSFNKGKYMMELDLEAANEQDTATTA